tara:strand:+ start:1106 stop:1207 length:102 start_codon:yes stop_codon:yes gene_type:complete
VEINGAAVAKPYITLHCEDLICSLKAVDAGAHA